ncbi:MAG: hypothetical protein K6G07_01760 [Lachnospiraceae bacterium]|nr:hypothetical protein [Lachnospiraceae bacterium]
MEENKYFKETLQNFTFDVASGGAIRHLADLWYSTEEIAKHLSFPTPKEQIAKTVYEHCFAKGLLSYEKTPKPAAATKTVYVKKQSALGKTTFLRKEVPVEADPPSLSGTYEEFSVGLLTYRSPEAYERFLHALTPEDRSLIEPLPWEKKPIYLLSCEKTEAMIAAYKAATCEDLS